MVRCRFEGAVVMDDFIDLTVRLMGMTMTAFSKKQPAVGW
jgi:hypothetical protein